ncbi:MAG: SCP2 sterol-binding domain-containing protein [Myxococcota bacterium]
MTPDRFFLENVPEEWNRRPKSDVHFDIAVEVRGEGGAEYRLSVEAGHMTAHRGASPDPLIRLVLGLQDWQRLAEQVGPSPMALLGGVSGESDLTLTPARVQALRELDGALLLRVSGDEAWQVLLCFAPGPAPETPDTEISIAAEQYQMIRNGELDLQGAFMTGKLQLEGNPDPALRLALALMTPEDA